MRAAKAAPEITPALLLRAYSVGVFPMADHRDSQDMQWFDPPERGILPLDSFHLPRRLRRVVLSDRFAVTTNTDFAAVIQACAAPRTDTADTWISPRIVGLYTALHRAGHAHSVECRHDGALVGGLYGVAIGAAFFGESMFSRQTDASKVALAHLVARLRLGGYRLLDTQFVTDHLTQFGATEIPRAHYRKLLDAAIHTQATWPTPDQVALHRELAQLGRAM